MEDLSEICRDQIRGDLARVPACDNCKDRKTKCDRGKPCSSCVTANLQCRITRTKPEKRQRIVISARYDEALERVDHRLQEVLESVRALQSNGILAAGLPQSNLQRAADFPTGTSHSIVSRLSTPLGGYRGDPSFDAQVRRAAGTLNNLAGRLRPQEPIQSVPLIADGSTKPDAVPLQTTLPFLQQHPEFEGHTLPPSEPILRLLRVIQGEKQRFFVDVAMIDEEQFTNLCRDVFFAINPYTMTSWSIVNTGLYYLFRDLRSSQYADIGLKAEAVDEIINLLDKNAQASAESMRVCLEPSIEGCQALGLLGTFCMKRGQIIKAWNLFSAASRMCLDLGLNRLPQGVGGHEMSRKRKVFWFIYINEKGLALTLGRTQVIYHYDVSTDHLSYRNDVAGIPGKIAAATVDIAILQGELHIQLFSASGHRMNQSSRIQRAKEFRERLRQIQAGVSRIHTESVSDTTFWGYTQVLEIVLNSLGTVICCAVASDVPGQQGHACAECITDARRALKCIVESGELLKEKEPAGWALFLNATLSLSPFTPYFVLVIHAVTEYAWSDLDLLASVNAVLEPVAKGSPFARQVYETCQHLYQFVEATIHRCAEARPSASGLSEQSVYTDSPDSDSVLFHNTFSGTGDGDLTMSLIDWPLVHEDLDLDAMLRRA